MLDIVLVTGGKGLVGQAVQDLVNSDNNFNKKYIFLSRKDGNLEINSEVRNIFKKYNPSYVIHLAAYVGGLYCNMREKVKMLESNVKINMNVIQLSHEYKVKKLICCLSTCIFPNNTNYPMTEDSLHQGPPHDSNYSYSYAKRLMEIQVRVYREEYGDNFMCVIPTNIYGPHDNFSLQNGHVVPSLIHKCHLSKINNTDFTLLGSCQARRQFLYSYDFGKILLLLLDVKYNDNLIISPPCHEEINILKLGKIIAKNCDVSEIKHDTNFSDGQIKKTVTNQKLLELFPNLQFTSLEYGIYNTVKWFRENYPQVRK
jgi:GDP-L-fucose synthase